MSLEQIANLTAPQAPLRLDTSTHIHATDENGKLIISETTGKPITLAQDTVSGAWYAKVADSMPFNGPKKSTLPDLIAAAAIHVPHQDERWRGVWVPMSWITEVTPEKTPEKPAA
jgi:hypothetical protein